MHIEILFFGVLKDLAGSKHKTVELADGSDVAALLRSPAVSFVIDLKSLAVAVNREYASITTLLHDGDEVALLPPVSGGSDAR